MNFLPQVKSPILEVELPGKQMDLTALKQEIQDDAGLLSNWRKAPRGSIDCNSGRNHMLPTHKYILPLTKLPHVYTLAMSCL